MQKQIERMQNFKLSVLSIYHLKDEDIATFKLN